MKHLTLKAAVTTATDQGLFEAVISTETVDREKDVVQAQAMVSALTKWNRPIPLAWNHSTSAADIIGHIDPASVKAENGEVVAGGQVDLESAVGMEAWRSFKSRTVGFSFGYLIPDGGSSKRAGGGRDISELDVFEVSATPTPMNNDTRVLSTKQVDQPPTASQLRILNSMIGQAQEYIAAEAEGEDAVEMAEVLETLVELRGEPGTEDEGPNAPMMEAASMTGTASQFNLSQQKANETGKEPARARPVDTLRSKADALILEVVSDGESLRKSPAIKAAPTAEPEHTPEQLRALTRDYMLETLRGEAG